MRDGTGLTEFAEKYPDRFFDIGIAEQHAIGLASGMSKAGILPVVPIYSSFYQRAYDQVIHDIAIQGLPIVLCVDRAGVVGNDGETHQGLLDMAFFRLIPNIEIVAPKDFLELEDMLEYAVESKKAVVIRYPRGGEEKIGINIARNKIITSKSEMLQEGNDITLLAIGKEVAKACNVAKELEKHKIKAEVINARFLKPLDFNQISKSIEKTKKVAVFEDGTVVNGLTTAVKELIVDKKIKIEEIFEYSYPDKFIEHGSVKELEKRYNLDVDSIVKDIKKKFER